MDMKEIKELVSILEKSTLATLEISENGKTIKLGKYAPCTDNTVAMPTMVTKASNDVSESVDLIEDKHEKPSGFVVSSPMVGVYYSKPSPDAEPFVKVGDKVKKGQTLCIIEAMKLMNEIVAEEDGEVVCIYPADGDLVEYGQELIVIGD